MNTPLDTLHARAEARRRSGRRRILLSIPAAFVLGLFLLLLADPQVAYRWWRRAPALGLERIDTEATPLKADPEATVLPEDERLALELLDLQAPRDRLRHLARLPGSDWIAAGGQGGLLLVDLGARREADGCVELPRTALHPLDTRDGLPDLRVEALLAEEGRVWVGTRGGLAEVVLGPEGPRVASRAQAGLVSPRISALARVGGRLLVATHDGGLHRLEGERLVPLRQLGRRGRQLEALLPLPDQGLLVAGRRGVGLLHPGRAGAVEWYGEAWVSQLRRTRGGRVLAAGPAGLFVVEAGALREISAEPVQRLLARGCDDEGCAGLLPVGLDGRLLGAPLSSPPVEAHDRLALSGLHLSATDRGLVLADGAGHRHLIRQGGLGDADVSALLAAGPGEIWVGTYDDGLWRLRGESSRRVVPQIIRVDALGAGPRGEVLVATPDGLFSVPPEGEPLRFGLQEGLPSEHVTDLTITEGGVLWVATAGGVARGEPDAQGTWRFRAWDEGSGLPLSNFGVVRGLPDGRVAFGALHGLLLREPAGEGSAFVALRPGEGGLPDGWVTAIAVGPGGELVLGTYDAGLVRMRPGEERFERLAVGIGELHGRVNPRALVVQGERLVAGTQGGGLLVVGPEGTRTFGLRHGLPSAEVTALAVAGDALLVGTRSGLARVRFVSSSPQLDRPTEVASR
ncbi:MAG: hypothetical protein P1V51_24930 [Deltaproteobacteria bacterium]|nr:hypothetical protein [Deltaproteobacteria bacterium]